jgi:hypothetical protein
MIQGNYPRSPASLVGGMVHLGRCIDKVRLRHAGKIQDYNYLTVGFDKYLFDFLKISPSEFERRVLEGGTDEEILAWVRTHSRPLTDADIRQWNEGILTSGPKDDAAKERFQARVLEAVAHRGLSKERAPTLRTWVEIIDFDEGRL